MKLVRIALVLFAVVVVAGAAAGGYVWMARKALIEFAATAKDASYTGDTVAVSIPKGSGPQKIASILEEKGVIADATSFYRWVRYIAKKQTALKAGEYELSPAMTPQQIVALLEVGR